MVRSRFYTDGEEVANALSHGMGILLGLVASFILLSAAWENGSPWATSSVIVYLICMLSSYVSSTWYHACKQEKYKEWLRKSDHAAIYLHIAGSYTPFTLITLREEGMWGWCLFAFVWLAALFGIIISFKKLKPHSNLETICFILMGCSIFVAFKPLLETLTTNGQIEMLYWLIAGGILYVIGALFYSWTKRKYMHTVFHLFVLGGSICHIMAIYAVII